MQPENLPKSAGPEKMPSMPRPNFERPSVTPGVEFGKEQVVEGTERSYESGAAVADVFSTTIPAQTDTATQDNPIVDDNTTAVDNSLVAADADLIEKEWVDRAKKIISDTKDDPYQRDEKVSKLQVEYIKKRYDRSIGLDENLAS